ncbi:MAG: hypothetical protein U0L18_09110, partial [Acutalibacteraceae bacterium]|nr:hypothetical protein [Acutalibacteraceae bacterium]
LNYEMLNNCSNFDLNINTRFSKSGYPTLYNCNNFSGNFRYVGNQDRNYPGFRGFLYDCKDGVFNIDCTNMHGGGNDANVTNCYNFFGIQGCNNMNVNITGSSWQVWPHDHSFSSNCNINTYNVISGFSYMNGCNFNVELPKDSKPEMNQSFTFLNDAENCNYNLLALDSNLFNYRSGAGHNLFFENLNNCNLNLLVNNTVSFDHSFSNNLHNCNIVFDNIKADLSTFIGWNGLYNCNISGNVESMIFSRGFVEHSNGLNVNLNFAKSSNVLAMWNCNSTNGNLVACDMTRIYYSDYMNLNVSGGNLNLINGKHSRFNLNRTNTYANNLNNCKFEIYNCSNFVAKHISNSDFNIYNAITEFRNVNNSNARSKSRAYVSAIDNCHNIALYSLNIVGGALIENVYDSVLAFNYGSVGRMFDTRRVDNCSILGFPTKAAYTSNCRFEVGLEEAMNRNKSYVTWANVWPHGSRAYSGSYGYLAGLQSVDNSIYRCYMSSDKMVFGGSKIFNNINNMLTSFGTYYNGVVTANLPSYNMEIKLNVDCNTLNLGVFQAGPPHGFEYSSVSADNIYCTTGKNYYVQMNYGTRVYCENFCNVAFSIAWRRFSDNYQPVILINNYQHSNSSACEFKGGIIRIGQLNYKGYTAVPLGLYNGACMFINNTKLGTTTVNNALLFLGTNVHFEGSVKVTNGGLIVNKANYTMNAIGKFVDRNNFTWNLWDSGPWGSQSLLNFCLNV